MIYMPANLLRTFLLLVGVLTFNLSMAQQQVIDQVIATVGGELILLSEVYEQKALLESQQSDLPEDVECFILDNIMAQKLLVNQAKLDSLPITDEEVELQLDARIDQILAYMQGDLVQFEAYYGQSVNEVKAQFREDLRSQILADRMRADIMTNITVTPSEVKSFFARIPVDSLPYFDSEVEVGEIVLLPEVNPEAKQLAYDKLVELRKQIMEEGADFAELALKFSDDFGSGRIGGDLGWTRRGKFVPEFEAEAYKLDVDEISPVFESEFGFHIVQLMGRRGNSIHTRHILVKPEVSDEDMENGRLKLDSIANLIRDDSISFSLAVKRFGNEDVQSFNNDGRMVNPQTGDTFFKIGDLDPDVYFAIDTMSIGSISSAFLFAGPTGEKMYRIVQLQSRTEPHVANLREDYSKIQDAAIEEKRSNFIQEWIADKVYSTYIDIDDRFMGCPLVEEKWLSNR